MTTPAKFQIPNDRYYDGVNHLWAKSDSTTGRIVIGIDELGLQALGDLVYITLKEVGTPVKRGEAVGTLEAAKMTGDIIAPVSGILIGRNDSVLRDPTLVNRDPYEKGWIVSFDPTDWKKESAALVSGEAIPAWVEAEVERYRMQGWI
ncbi:MAG: glycine cleavage system protein H [candidate division KSB1 bacterium]|nr:glycine cleavage system protein H [candidate division KSB1 bacterium]MDZ7274064.1 glycine cleavage system protein H [candidate division KSB1 bacterium]MDZ7287890.1 glycine cleavage system protein H [candidate division KSB1 bacterium]MDZ7296664.1 glycine cleavage system protein H [candidate division KSB1 bacterium]MDZ7307281.1 glycine cleavage system protein H [candidate division KSB1 bacterium]